MPSGGSKTTPISHESVDKNAHPRLIEAAASVCVVVKHFALSVETVLGEGSSQANVDLYIPHQANIRMLQSLVKSLDLANDVPLWIVAQGLGDGIAPDRSRG